MLASVYYSLKAFCFLIIRQININTKNTEYGRPLNLLTCADSSTLLAPPWCTVGCFAKTTMIMSWRYSLFAQSSKTTVTFETLVQLKILKDLKYLKLCDIVNIIIVCIISYRLGLGHTPGEGAGQTTYSSTDITTYRLNQPRGQLLENLQPFEYIHLPEWNNIN